jgi:type 1 glutamine amidotransferase
LFIVRVSLAALAVVGSTLFAEHAAAATKKSIVMIAGRPSHGPGEHEHNAGIQLLAKCLKQGLKDQVDVKVHLNGEWPGAEELDNADTIVIYCDGGGGHVALQKDRLAQLEEEMKRGCGFVCLHYAVEPAYERENWKEEKGADGKPIIPAGRRSKGKGAKEFLDWMGGYFEQYWSVNPHWLADFKEFPKHPITQGVKPFSANDEWYYHMRFRDSMRGVTPILSAVPTEDTTKRGEGPHSGNPEQRKEVLEDKKPQAVAWAAEREGGGRGFGFTGGHFHRGWANNDQRKLVLNAIYWTAKGDVPQNGVESMVTADDMSANLDPKGKR